MLPERNRRNTGRGRTIRAIGAALALLAGTASADTTSRELDFQGLRPVESGHRSYYELRKDERGTYLHADYQAGDEATKQALVLPESERRGHHKLTWRWRALVLPGGRGRVRPGQEGLRGVRLRSVAARPALVRAQVLLERGQPGRGRVRSKRHGRHAR